MIRRNEVFEGNKIIEPHFDYNLNIAKYNFFGDNGNFIPFNENILSTHMLFLGSIGTGKTTALMQLIEQIIDNLNTDDMIIIFDTKGDYFDKFYRIGDVVISNDKTATGKRGVDYWNIFGEIGTGHHMSEDVNEISRVIFNEKIKRSNQPFFPIAAKDIFSSILLSFMRNLEDNYKNNMALKSFFDSKNVKGIRDELSLYKDLQSKANYISDSNSPQTQGVITELYQVVNELFIGNFDKEGSLSIRKMVREKNVKVVFVEYDLGIGNILTPVYSLLFDMALKEALSRNINEKSNVFLVLDEFSLLPDLQHIDDAINFGRSLGVKLLVGLQNINQVYNNYGEYRAKSLLSGLSTTVCFRVNDESTRNYISGLYGRNRKKEIFMSEIQSRGINESIRDGFVVEDWDISSLTVGEAIIGLPNTSPFRFKFRKGN